MSTHHECFYNLHVPDSDAIPQLALPRGLQFRTQKNSLSPSFHSFVITREDGSRLYGFAYTFFERVEDRATCDTMHTLQVTEDRLPMFSVWVIIPSFTHPALTHNCACLLGSRPYNNVGVDYICRVRFYKVCPS